MAKRSARSRTSLALALGLLLLLVGAVALWLSLPDVSALRTTNPRTTALIQQRIAEARQKGRALRPRQTWRRLEEVSPWLVAAILLSEDAAFYGHDGFDWDELSASVKKNLEKGRFARGGSTLTQQLAKNLYLGTEKSLLRKVKEAVIALKLEQALTKKRILTLYLNVVELDAGVFGVDAGARAHFGKGAHELSIAQSVVLASLLPAPLTTRLESPSPRFTGRVHHLLDVLLAAGRISAAEHAAARTELSGLLGRETAGAEEGP